MVLKAPWDKDMWKTTMEKYGFELEKEPFFNSYSLFVTMNMIMSDSSETLVKYVGNDKIFSIVYDLALDKLTDKDKNFKIRDYFLK